MVLSEDQVDLGSLKRGWWEDHFVSTFIRIEESSYRIRSTEASGRGRVRKTPGPAFVVGKYILENGKSVLIHMRQG